MDVTFPSGNLAAAAAAITFNGQGGVDTVLLWDDLQGAAQSYVITSTTVSRAGFGGLNYSTLERVALIASVAGDTVNVNSTAAGAPVELAPNSGTDLINVNETNATAPVQIDPSSGDDTVNVNTDGVGSATALFPGTMRIGALTIGSGGLAQLTSSGAKVLSMTSLNITGTGKLDLTDNDAIIDYTGASPVNSIHNLLASGYAAGVWNGAGINSSVAASNPVKDTALGYGESSAILGGGGGTFSGVAVDATAILIKYTWYADANLDGKVDTLDFNTLAANFGGSGKHWFQGDFNFDGLVDTLDFNKLAANFGKAGL
jgi:hypothetical protein